MASRPATQSCSLARLARVRVSRQAQRLILLTATPHSGKDTSLWALLRLLDLDAWGDRCPRRLDVPERFFRKVPKEKMTDMAGKPLFLPRHPHTLDYDLEGEELELYDAVTDFVSRELREIKGDKAGSAAGFALTTMQRRLASSVRAIAKTLERRFTELGVTTASSLSSDHSPAPDGEFSACQQVQLASANLGLRGFTCSAAFSTARITAPPPIQP